MLLSYRIMAISVLIFSICEGAPALAKAQYIQSFPGFVPVYIRPGDTPLQDINPDLAEAFNFNALKHGRLVFGKQINEIISENKKKEALEELENKLKLEKDNVIDTSSSSQEFQHIQKILKH